MEEKWEAACSSNKGKIREKNEDNFYFDGFLRKKENETLACQFAIQTGDEGKKLFAVFDGLGGVEGGEIASYIAADCLLQDSSVLAKLGVEDFVPENFLENAVGCMNHAVCQEAQSGFPGMGTTAVILCFFQEMVYVCNVGDSRAYSIHEDGFVQLSKDHTDAKFMAERKIAGRKPRLTQCIGIPPEEMLIEPYITKRKWCRGDKYLLCSDGLTDMLSEQEIADIMGKKIPAAQCVSELMETALARGGKDNITVIIVQKKQETEDLL